MTQQTEKDEAGRVVEGGEADRASQQRAERGDNRTPDKTIGQVKYADNEGGSEQPQSGSPRKTSATKKEGLAND